MRLWMAKKEGVRMLEAFKNLEKLDANKNLLLDQFLYELFGFQWFAPAILTVTRLSTTDKCARARGRFDERGARARSRIAAIQS